MKRIALALALPALVALGACNSSDTTAPGPDFSLTADDTLQAAVNSAADATAEDIDLLGSIETSIGDAGPASVGYDAFGASLTGWGSATNCNFNVATSRFDCATQTTNGLTLTRSFGFFDASHNPVTSMFKGPLTDSVDIVSTVAGVRVRANGADTLSRNRHMGVSGLAGANTTRTWNGTGHRIDGWYRDINNVKRTAHVTDTTTVTNVVIQLPRTSHPYPVSGSITRHVMGTGTVTRQNRTKRLEFDKTVTITFNGTANATLTVGTSTWTVNLTTGDATEN